MRNFLRHSLLFLSAGAILSVSLSALPDVGFGSFVSPAAADWPCGMEYVNGTIEFNPYQPCMRHPEPERAPLPDVWGAIATAPNMGWGYVSSRPTEAAARAEAIRQCRLRNPGSVCKVVVTVPDVCVALAMSDSDSISTIGGPIGAVNVAEDGAMLKCQRAGGRSCVIKKSFCADGIQHVTRGETIYSNGNPIFIPQGEGLPFGRKR